MKKILLLILLADISFNSCNNDDIDNLKKNQSSIIERLSALETWQTSVNNSISSLQTIISALEAKDYVTGVSPLADGSGYVINFLKSGAVTIKHGEKGDTGTTPIIGTKQDTDGKYYWTLNGEWLTDNGAKMPVTGDKGDNGDTPYIGDNGNWWIASTDTGIKAQGEDGASGNDGIDGNHGETPYIGNNGNWWIGSTDKGVKAQGEDGNDGYNGNDAVAPKVRINIETGEWEISVNNGSTWSSTGVKAQGDAVFAAGGVDNSASDYITLTLADGTTTIQLPRYKAFKIG